MKIIDLLNAQPALQSIAERKMPAKLAYCIAKNFRLINTELEDYNKTRIKLLSDNWVLNPKTDKYDIPDKDQEKWKKLHDDLIQSECDFLPFKVNISLTDNLDWAPSELLALWFIFEGEGAEDLAPKVEADNKE